MPHSSILLQIPFHSFIQLPFPHWLHSLDEERDTLTKMELRSITVKESAITLSFPHSMQKKCGMLICVSICAWACTFTGKRVLSGELIPKTLCQLTAEQLAEGTATATARESAKAKAAASITLRSADLQVIVQQKEGRPSARDVPSHLEEARPIVMAATATATATSTPVAAAPSLLAPPSHSSETKLTELSPSLQQQQQHNIEDGSGKRNVSVSEGLIRDVDIKPPSAGAVLNAARLAAGQ